ncbi:MAG TPA: ABC transporter substrate-binding protein [Terriglobales bacterium]|nr:ABC transporter substrate-binding protein [Terriglobales bacterium]
MVRVLLAFALACLIPLGLSSAADAQQPASPRRVGVLLVTFSLDSKEAQAFREGLRDAGYTEGRDVVIEWRSADGDYKKLPGLVTDLVQRKVDVIVVDTTPATRAVKRTTSTIPIVMSVVADPVGSGLVTNLAHPGGNVTGLSMMYADINAKRLQLLTEAIPRLTRVAVLWNPDNSYHPIVVNDLKAAALSLSIELRFVSARTLEEFGPAFSDVSGAHAQALYVVDDAQFVVHRATLVKLASKARLPTISATRYYVDEGGLMSYGANIGDLFRRSAGYVDKILKGTRPGDLPIEQPTTFELVVNLKAAKALGLTIPESILLRADEVIR